MFARRQRPNGVEFAACEECNSGTRTADAVAAMIARIGPQPLLLPKFEVLCSARLHRNLARADATVSQHRPSLRVEENISKACLHNLARARPLSNRIN
jgi:hypothetical protein